MDNRKHYKEQYKYIISLLKVIAELNLYNKMNLSPLSTSVFCSRDKIISVSRTKYEMIKSIEYLDI